MKQSINDKNSNRISSFLSFKLGAEFFVIPVMRVMEIVEVPPITIIPKAPPFMKGVINLRGAVLPVIDGRAQFGMPPTDLTINSCIIVIDIEMNGEHIHVGALVDRVLGVFEIEEKDIQPSPAIGAKYKAEFIEGMIKEGEQFMMLLDVDAIFSALEMDVLLEER